MHMVKYINRIFIHVIITMLLLFLHNIIETLDSKLILKIVTNSANKNRYNNIIQTYLDEAYMVLLK